MKTKSYLKRLFDVILAEVENNPEFASKLSAVFASDGERRTAPPKRRRSPATLDPVRLLEAQGEAELRLALAALDIEKLKDVVAEFVMDPAKLVMKWKDPERIIEHIVVTTRARVTKGDAFRS